MVLQAEMRQQVQCGVKSLKSAVEFDNRRRPESVAHV